jgi:hypothetical protein
MSLIGRRGLAECQSVGFRFVTQGIAALGNLPPCLKCSLPRHRQKDRWERTEPHVPTPPIDLLAQNPGRPGRFDDQHETATRYAVPAPRWQPSEPKEAFGSHNRSHTWSRFKACDDERQRSIAAITSLICICYSAHWRTCETGGERTCGGHPLRHPFEPSCPPFLSVLANLLFRKSRN